VSWRTPGYMIRGECAGDVSGGRRSKKRSFAQCPEMRIRLSKATKTFYSRFIIHGTGFCDKYAVARKNNERQEWSKKKRKGTKSIYFVNHASHISSNINDWKLLKQIKRDFKIVNFMLIRKNIEINTFNVICKIYQDVLWEILFDD